MSVLRNHPKGAQFASFGIGLLVFALMPRETGYQDIGSLLARQPGVAERWQKQVFSAASSTQLATYSFSRPIGTSAPSAFAGSRAGEERTFAGVRLCWCPPGKFTMGSTTASAFASPPSHPGTPAGGSG